MQEKVITVPKKTLFLVLPYLGPLSLQTRTKLRKSLKGILNCFKLQIVLKSQNKLVKAFCLRDRIPKDSVANSDGSSIIVNHFGVLVSQIRCRFLNMTQHN